MSSAHGDGGVCGISDKQLYLQTQSSGDPCGLAGKMRALQDVGGGTAAEEFCVFPKNRSWSVSSALP